MPVHKSKTEKVRAVIERMRAICSDRRVVDADRRRRNMEPLNLVERGVSLDLVEKWADDLEHALAREE